MDIVARHPFQTPTGRVVILEDRIPYDQARKQIERTVDLKAYEQKPAVLSVWAQLMYGCDHAEILPDGRQEWVNSYNDYRLRLEASV
jgi:hypothetical protein